MPATLYLRPQPRAFFLVTSSHALVFRQPSAAESKASRNVVVAEFLSIKEVSTSGLVPLSRGRTVEGVLGVTSVPTDRSPIPDIFLLFLSTSSSLSPLSPTSSLRPARVVGVEFHSLTSSFWDAPDIPRSNSHGHFDQDDAHDPYYSASFQSGGVGGASSSSPSPASAAAGNVEHPCAGMKKYLESGGFFYAEDCKWDISSRMGEVNWIQAEQGRGQHPLETFDERFVWNAAMLAPFMTFRAGLPGDVRERLDQENLLIPVIQGFVGSLPVSTGQWTAEGKPEIAALGLISRLSWKRAGARFRTRGIDDDGQVANFVETEVILATGNVTFSWVVVRGSVPLFWQQPSQGIGTLQQKVEITRPPQASQPAFDKHFLELIEHYHAVHAVNLLGQRDAEEMLSEAYSSHLAHLRSTLEAAPADEKAEMGAAKRGMVNLTPYDFHAAVRTHGHEAVRYDLGTRIREMVGSRERFGWTALDTQTGQIIEQQQGVFRVNCLDCLDRTNYVQDVISSLTLTSFLVSINSPLAASAALWSAHRELWADNGDRLSKIYAGTGALNTSATRSGKKTFAGLLSDATKSVGRAYINNFQDKGKQVAIDLLLGMMAGQRQVILFDPIGESVQASLRDRISEYSRLKSISIFVGTWNLNGKAPNESLDPWLFPAGAPEADIYMIAFQEIVELTAGQILQTDPAKRRMWEKYIMDTFAMRQEFKSKYLLYRSEQLVGTALIVVMKASLAPAVRHVESATKKTGLQGLSGNKGGVGIRFNLFDSTVCLMTCHLAAGHSNVTERNADYRTISSGLKFLRGKTIDDHDIIVWAADFNYRISLPNEEVREYAETGQLDQLLSADQLMQAIDEQEVFNGYTEGPLTFRPTYKYDNGSDTYDSSDKARIPAWTDRILFRGESVRLDAYDRAELKTSDHRPVYALFTARVREVDQVKKERIQGEIQERVRGGVGEDLLGELEDEDERVDLSATQTISQGSANGLAIAKTKAPPPMPPPSRVKTPIISVTPRTTPAAVAAASTTKPTPKLPPRPSMLMSAEDVAPEHLKIPLVPNRSPSSSSSAKLPLNRPPPALPTRKPSINPTSPVEAKKGSVASAISAFEAGRNKPSTQTQPPRAPISLVAPEDPVSVETITESPSITPASTGDYMIVKTGQSKLTRPAAPGSVVGTESSLPPRPAPPPSRITSSTARTALPGATQKSPATAPPLTTAKKPAPIPPSTEASSSRPNGDGTTALSANVVPSAPPPLPMRQPTRQATLDMDAPPPKELATPVLPPRLGKGGPGLGTEASKDVSGITALSGKRPPPAVAAKPKNLRSTSVTSVSSP